MTDFTLDQYNACVDSMAQEIIDELMEHGGDYYDLLNNEVDGSEYIIYTRYHHAILWFSGNADKAIDDGLLDISKKSTATGIIQTMAFHAMEADIDERVRYKLTEAKEQLEGQIDELEQDLETIKAIPASVEKQIESLQEKLARLEEI